MIITRFKYIFINQSKNHYNQHTFVNDFFSFSIKIGASGFNQLLERITCLLLAVEAFSLQKVVEMPEEVVVSWREVR